MKSSEETYLLKKLKSVIEEDPMNASWLSYRLGYISHHAVTNWLKRKSIPRRQLAFLDEAIQEIKSEKRTARRV